MATDKERYDALIRVFPMLVSSEDCPRDRLYMVNKRYRVDGTLDMEATAKASGIIYNIGEEN